MLKTRFSLHAQMDDEGGQLILDLRLASSRTFRKPPYKASWGDSGPYHTPLPRCLALRIHVGETSEDGASVLDGRPQNNDHLPAERWFFLPDTDHL